MNDDNRFTNLLLGQLVNQGVKPNKFDRFFNSLVKWLVLGFVAFMAFGEFIK